MSDHQPPTLPMNAQPPSYQPPKKRHTMRWVLIFIGAVFSLLLIVLVGSVIAAVGSVTSKSPASVPLASVIYSVTSDAPTVSVTYGQIQSGGVQQAQDNQVTPPWTKTVTGDKSLFHSYDITAQMIPPDMQAANAPAVHGTTISCSITVDGKVVAHNTSTGPFAVVICNAS